jgi:hypothetical protein
MKRNSLIAIFFNLIFFAHLHAQNGNYYKQSANHKIDHSPTNTTRVDSVQYSNPRPGNYKNSFNHDQFVPIERYDSASVNYNKSNTPPLRNYKHSF